MPSITELSILIPVYNHVCVELVRGLLAQCSEMPRGFRYEVVVIDDASTDIPAIKANNQLGEMENCRYLRLETNVGRSKIRNILAGKAKFSQLIYLDCDVKLVNDNFIRSYCESSVNADVVSGGVTLLPDPGMAKSNLRYRYERMCLPKFTVEKRTAKPHDGFRTSNFRVSRELILKIPFDERLLHYGYEDVLWGKSLLEAGIKIEHIDNPVAIDDFEPNREFIAKTEEGICTLAKFTDDVRGYSIIITVSDKLHRIGLEGLARCTFTMLKPLIKRAIITGINPNVILFQAYRVGCFLEEKHKLRASKR